MKTTKLTLNARDGLLLHGLSWMPSKPKAYIVVIHGLWEHAGRYKRFAEAAVARGFGVTAVDLRGHGLSPGESTFVENFSEFLLDVDAIIAHTRELAGSQPIMLMGHSLGGAIATRWIAERQPSPESVAGLALSSAALKIGKDVPKVLQVLAPMISLIAPRLRLSAADPKSISRDPVEIKRYLEDPLNCHRPAQARTGAEILAAIAANRLAARVLTQPIYLFHGGRDTLTDPDGSRELYKEWGGKDKTLRIWPNSVHETLNDLDRVDVTRELLDWITSKTKAKKPAVEQKVAVKAAPAKNVAPKAVPKAKAKPAPKTKAVAPKKPAAKLKVVATATAATETQASVAPAAEPVVAQSPAA